MLTLISISLAVAIVYVGLCAWLYFSQRSLLYFPQPRRLGPTQSVAQFNSGDALLQLTVSPQAGPRALLYFGGNGEDVSGSLAPLTEAFPDREIVMLHYRGYGGSTGRPTEQSLTEDAARLFDKVHAEHPDVIVMGTSLGTGVAMRLASTRPVSRLILVTPYDSLLEVAARRFPIFPLRYLLIDKFESWRYVPGVNAPTLILAAEHDEVISTASTEQLRDRFPARQVSYVVIPRATHNTISDAPDYLRALAAFNVASADAAEQSAPLASDGGAPRMPLRYI